MSNSESLEKRYLFFKGVFKIQNDYAHKYELDKKTQLAYENHHHKRQWLYAIILNDIQDLRASKNFFANSSASKITGLSMFLLISFFEFLIAHKISQKITSGLMKFVLSKYHSFNSN